MTLNADVSNFTSRTAKPFISGLVRGITRAPKASFNAVGAFGKSMQVSRMAGVLSAMNDKELSAIGITRGEIPKHAEFLVG